MQSTRHHVIAVIAALATSAGAVALAMSYRRPDPPTPPSAPGMTVGSDSIALTAAAPEWSLLHLESIAVAEPSWSEPIPARIVFDESHASRVGAPLAGRVTSVAVERGQQVKAGAALFVVASSSLAELRAAREKAMVERTTAHANLARTQALVDAQFVPGKDIVTAREQSVEADLAVDLADHKLAALRVGGAEASSFTVTAPRDGVVVDKNVAVGQQIDASASPAITIADLSVVWLVADVFESDVHGLAVGTRARCIIEGAETAAEIESTVAQVSAIVEPERHTVPIRVRLDNAGGGLRPNAYAQVRFLEPSSRATLPASAVMSSNGKRYVYLNEHGTLIRHIISVGEERHGRVPILSELDAKAQVVSRGAILIDNELELSN